MIIKDIRIYNFRSYYGCNHITLSKGLTLIIGDNGDGKTTIFEALEWLFDTKGENRKETHISEKRKAELNIGESDVVSVSITFEHDGDKEIEKSFTFERASDDSIITKNYKFVGCSNEGSERKSEPGDKLLERCFETVIRKYCMFKGENELNVFDEETALKTLVNTFSGVRDFDKLTDWTSNFDQSSARAANSELQKDKNVSKQATELNRKLEETIKIISETKSELSRNKIQKEKLSNNLERLEQSQETCERCREIKERIKSLKDQQARLNGVISCNYSTNLLDEYWILRSFPTIINEFSAKVSSLSKEKRRLKELETRRQGKAEGVREAISMLTNGAVPLPWNLPDKKTMQEMIDDEVCKVCGRPAPKGSEPYEFMRHKLEDYLAHINIADTKEDKPLFENRFINELQDHLTKISGETERDIAKIATDIEEELAFVSKRKSELEKVNEQLQDLEGELNNISIQSGLSQDLIESSIKDWRGFTVEYSRAETRIHDLEAELKSKESEKADIQERLSKLEPESTMTKVYQRVHIAFEKIKDAFANAREQNINIFLHMLEEHANTYLQKLNKNDFAGRIRIRKTIEESARIELHSADGKRIENPNGALKTTMYMSVLFAISQITTLKREQDYPLIFDAPTSSFGSFKEGVFYNVIDSIDKQCVIVTKDLLNVDRTTGAKSLDYDTIDKLSCSVYRIKKVEPFDDKDLSTIQTVVEQVR